MKNIINLQITIPRQTRYLQLVGKIGESLAKEVCFSEIDCDTFTNDLNTVLTESVTNTIKHGSQHASDSCVKICIKLSDNEVTIKIFDSGQGFNLKSIPSVNFDSNLLEESGRGINIIRKIMDTVAYKKLDRGNVFEMSKIYKK